MNKFIFLIIFYFPGLRAASQNIADLEAFEKGLKPGTQLIYDVGAGDKKFQLTLTIKKLGGEILFDWKASGPDNKSGNVTMSPAATQNATALVMAPAAGETKLENETAFWISKKVFNDIATTSQTALKLNGAGDTLTPLSNTIGEFNFNQDGNLLAVPGWELSGGPDNKYIIDVLESKYPVIYRIETGLSMILTEVKSP